MSIYSLYLSDLKGVIDNLPLDQVKRAADIVFNAHQAGRTLFLFGNGGSAALASHMAADLGKGTHVPGPAALANGKRMKVFSVTDNSAILTAWANDAAYEDVFARQIEPFMGPGDVAFGISGSGNSPNVLRALELARRVNATTVGFTGFGGGKMKDLLDCAVVVASDNMQQIEDAHVILSHLVFIDLRARFVAGAEKNH
ncbi:MAG TPA: SIS domain-containing protein [Terriglobia bacterium]|nr:SIS domain-containing protein [Terriglobia bacterium]